MKLKKLFVILTVISLMSLGILSNGDVYAEGDNQAPIITNVIYDNSIATPNTLTITYSIEEEGVGAKDIFFDFVKFDDGELREICIRDDSFSSSPRHSGTYTVSATIPESQAGGKYYLVGATCWDMNDNAGRMDLSNHWSYGGNGTDDSKVNGGDTSLVVIDPPGHDSTAPVITNVSYANSLSTPNSLTITYSIEETGVGAKDIFFEFVKFENDELRTIDISDAFTERKTGTYTVTAEVPASQDVGTYYLVAANCRDENDNVGRLDLTSHWSYGGSGYDDSRVNGGDTSLIVIDPVGHDDVAPIITDVKYAKSLTTPDTLNIQYSIVEEGVGADDISFEFVKVENDEVRTIDIYDTFTARKTGTYSISAKVPTSQEEGTYYLVYATCWDMNDNAGGMDLSDHWSYGGNGTDDNKVNNGDTSLVIKDEFDPEFETFITNPNLNRMLANMNDNGVALVGYNESNGIAKKELFEAIAGTNKTIVFQDNGFQWIVTGADITGDCKDVDLRINVFSDNAQNYGAEANNVIVFRFADNGTLPGTMKVRAKVRYLLNKNAKLYYFNNNSFVLENEEGFGFYDGEEPWCEIEVSHNSTFLLSNKVLVRMTGWQKINGEWYYLKVDGHMASSTWMKDSKGWCYLGSDGKMVTNGWAKDSKGWCWMGSDGHWTSNKWVKDRTEWYYIKSNHYMASNEWTKDSKGWCYLGSDGKMVTNGWAKDSKGWCWMGADGYWTSNKWVKDRTEWYYIKSNHYMAANEWTKDSSGWMYMNGSGKITKNKWIKDGNYWYYLKANGYMATGKQIIGGKSYTFNSSGKWVK